jgi:hypothetical protein
MAGPGLRALVIGEKGKQLGQRLIAAEQPIESSHLGHLSSSDRYLGVAG